MKDYNRLKEALKKLNELKSQYKDELEYAGLLSNFRTAPLENIIKLSEELDIRLPESTCAVGTDKYKALENIYDEMVRFSENVYMLFWTEDRKISWPDDGKQPAAGEALYIIRFPTGAYFLHSEYPKELFDKLFNSLKNYNPKYCDSANHALYFDKYTAKIVHKALPDIIKQYRTDAKPFVDAMKIAKLKDEIEKLEGSDS